MNLTRGVMMSSLFLIEKLAPMTQYQDLGRFGHLHNGFSHSGAMDETAFAINNRLLGNADNATQIEFALGGLQLRALADCTIAISGAEFNATLNGKPLANFASHTVLQNDVLAFGFAADTVSGQYAYLAVAGGFAVKPFLDSTATTQRLAIYPNHYSGGEALGEYSILAGDNRFAPLLQSLPKHQQPDYANTMIEVIPAYQFEQFSETARQQFSTQTFSVKATNRMGTKLTAEQPIIYDGGELLSEGIIPGAIQIPPDGNPIVLQKDAQSIGGYPKIGVVPSDSLSRLAQQRAGQGIRFYWL